MVDYRDDYNPAHMKKYDDKSSDGMSGTLIAIALALLALAGIFWYAADSTPSNGVAPPEIKSTAPAPANIAE